MTLLPPPHPSWMMWSYQAFLLSLYLCGELPEACKIITGKSLGLHHLLFNWKTTLRQSCSTITNQLVSHCGGEHHLSQHHMKHFPGQNIRCLTLTPGLCYFNYCILSIFKVPPYTYCDIAFNSPSLCFHCKLSQGNTCWQTPSLLLFPNVSQTLRQLIDQNWWSVEQEFYSKCRNNWILPGQ